MRPETQKTLEKIKSKLFESRYVVLVLLVGLVLLLLPTSSGDRPSEDADGGETAPTGLSVEDAERRLEDILSLIDGAGQVRVLLTLDSDGERVLARESQKSVDSRDGESSEETSDSALVVQKGSGQSGEVEVKYIYPRYRGAVVVARGAGSAAVREALTDAVSSATGLGPADITILKMG